MNILLLSLLASSLLLVVSCRATSPQAPTPSPAVGATAASSLGLGDYDVSILSLGACEVDVRPPAGTPTVVVQQQAASNDLTAETFDVPFEISTTDITPGAVEIWLVDPDDPQDSAWQYLLHSASQTNPAHVTVRVPHDPGGTGQTAQVLVGAASFRTSFAGGTYNEDAPVRKAREFEVASQGNTHYSRVVFGAYGRRSGFGLKAVEAAASSGGPPSATGARAAQDSTLVVPVRLQVATAGPVPQPALPQARRFASPAPVQDGDRTLRSAPSVGQGKGQVRSLGDDAVLWEQVQRRLSEGDAWRQPHLFTATRLSSYGMPMSISMAITPSISLGNCVIDVRPPEAPPTVFILREDFAQGPPIRVEFTLQTFKVPPGVRILLVDPDDPTGAGVQMPLLHQQENQLVLEVSQSQDDAWIRLNGGPRAHLRSASGTFDPGGGVGTLAENQRERLAANDHLTNLELSAFGRQVRLTLRAIE